MAESRWSSPNPEAATWKEVDFHASVPLDQRGTALSASLDDILAVTRGHAGNRGQELRNILAAHNAQNLQMLEGLLTSGVGGRAMVHLHQGTGAMPLMYLSEAGGNVSNLPFFGQTNLASLGSSFVIPTSRMRAGGLEGPTQILSSNFRRANNLRGGGVRSVAAAVEAWRQFHTLHHRRKLGGGTAPWILSHRVRLSTQHPSLVDDAGIALAPQIAQARQEMIAQHRTLTREGPGIMVAEEKLHKLVNTLVERAQGLGLHTTGIVDVGLAKSGYFTFSALKPTSISNDPYWDYRKGEHQHVQKMAIQAQSWMRQRSPHLVNADYFGAMKSTQAVERMRGRAVGGAAMITDMPIMLGAFGLHEAAPSALHRRVSETIGDSAAFVTSPYARRIAMLSPDMSGHREVVLDNLVGERGKVGSSVTLHRAFRPYSKLGMHQLSTGISYRDLIDTARSQYVSARIREVERSPTRAKVEEYRYVFGQEFDKDRELRRRASIIGYSADDTTGRARAIHLKPGEVVTGLDVGPNRTRLFVEPSRQTATDLTGVRTVIGSTRASLVDTKARLSLRGGASIDLVMAEGSLGARPEFFRMSTAIGRVGMSDMPLEQKRAAQQVFANIFGGSTFELDGLTGREVGVKWSAVPEGKTPLQVIRQAEQEIGQLVFPSLQGESLTNAIQNNRMFRVPYQDQALSLRELLQPASLPVDSRLAVSMGRRMGLSKAETAALKQHGRVLALHTNLSLRTSQPGYTQGPKSVRMTFRRLQLMSEIFDSALRDGPATRAEVKRLESTSSLMSRLSGDALRRAMADRDRAKDSFYVKRLWNRLSTPGTRRGKAMYQGAWEMVAMNQGTLGNVASANRIMSLADYQRNFGQEVYSIPRGGLHPSTMGNSPFFDSRGRGTSGISWVELPQDISIQTQDRALRTRYVPVLSGAALGMRKGKLIHRSKLGLVEATFELHQALSYAGGSSPNLDSIRQAASKVVDKFGESFAKYSKKGFVGRMHGGQGSLMPLSSLKPGEIGTTLEALKGMGASHREIEMAQKGQLFSMFMTDPASSHSHFRARRLRLIDQGMGPTGNPIWFLNAGDFRTVQRDSDADVGKAIFSSRHNRGFKAMFTMQGGYAAAARGAQLPSSKQYQVVAQDMMEGMGFPEARAMLGLATTPAEMAEFAAQRSRPKAVTAAVHTFSDKAARFIGNVARGATMEQLGLSGATAHEAAAFDRLREITADRTGEKLYHISKTSEAFIYTALKKAQKTSAGNRFMDAYLRLSGGAKTTVGSKKWKAGIANLEGAMSELMQEWPLEQQLDGVMRHQVAEAIGLTSPLMAAGGRPLQEAVTRRRGVPSGGMWSNIGLGLYSLFTRQMDSPVPSPNLTRGLGDGSATTSAQQAAADAAEKLKSIPNKSAYSFTKMLQGVSARISDMWKNNRAFRWTAVAGAGVMLAGSLLGRSKSESEEIVPAQSGGASVAPDANIGLPGPSDMSPNFSAFSLPEAPIRRPMGVRTHHRVSGAGPGGVDFTSAGDEAYGTPWSPVVHSGGIQDDSSGQKHRHELEHEIRKRMRSSF